MNTTNLLKKNMYDVSFCLTCHGGTEHGGHSATRCDSLWLTESTGETTLLTSAQKGTNLQIIYAHN